MNKPRWKTRFTLVLFLALTGQVSAQVPSKVLHTLLPPPVGIQPAGHFGFSTAMDGNYVVVGAPYDDFGAEDAGVVKIFHATTGQRLFVLPNPRPHQYDRSFGRAVAISGTRVVVGASDDEVAYVYELSSGTPSTPVLALHPSATNEIGGFGESVSISGTRVAVGGGSAGGVVCVFDLSAAIPELPVITLSNPGPSQDDGFGSAAISGTRVVVGAAFNDTGDDDAGCAYVFDLNSATPTVPVLVLNNPAPDDNDHFGRFVAIAGDWIVVGAPDDNVGLISAGRAFVYDLASLTPAVPRATIPNPNPGTDDFFGFPVAISGTRVAVGAFFDDVGAGRVYVFDAIGGTPAVPINTLIPPANGKAYFGIGLAITGSRLAVGASNQAYPAPGAAYLYELTGLTPTVPTTTIEDPGPAAGDNFGQAVAVSGTRLAVGSPGDDSGGENSGRVYIHDLSSPTPAGPVLTINNPAPAAQDSFGNAVAISGTLLVVGAAGDSTGASGAGSAYVYDLAVAPPGTLIRILNNPVPAAGDNFGSSVAISGTRVVIGAQLDDVGGNSTGTAYVYDLSSPTPTVPIRTLNKPGPVANDVFGCSVAISGTRLVVGAFGDDTGANAAGRAFVYDLSSPTPTVPIYFLNNPTPAMGEFFGQDVAISGTRVLVSGIRTGNAYLYNLGSGTPNVPVAVLTNPDLGPSGAVISAVAISNTWALVGGIFLNAGLPDPDSVFVYDLANETSTLPVATLRRPGEATAVGFGSALAVDGATVIAGAPGDDSVMWDKGAAYVFGPNVNDADGDGLLDSWEVANFGTTVGHRASDDFDRDGRNDLLELAFATNPAVPSANGIPAPSVDSGYLTLTFTKRLGASYSVESAGTLDTAAFSAASTKILVNDAVTLKVRDDIPVALGSKRFLRANITAAP